MDEGEPEYPNRIGSASQTGSVSLNDDQLSTILRMFQEK